MEELRIDLTRESPTGSGQRIGDLILDIFGRTSHPFGRYDLLIIADVGNRVYRNRIAGNDPPCQLNGEVEMPHTTTSTKINMVITLFSRK